MYAADKTLVVKMSLKRKSAASAGDGCEESGGSEKGTVLRNRSAGQLESGRDSDLKGRKESL